MANFEGEDFDWTTIEPNGVRFDVYGHGVYGSCSVLCGQPRRAFLEGFGTLEEAQAKYPEADVLAGSSKVHLMGSSLADLSGLPRTAPSDFDPLDAGEHWDEDY